VNLAALISWEMRDERMCQCNRKLTLLLLSACMATNWPHMTLQYDSVSQNLDMQSEYVTVQLHQLSMLVSYSSILANF
jgi:hypothetical protein